MNKKRFYITTTLPYVNAEPHLGHALEFIRADIIARWKKIQGFDVFFNTGTDEHGQKLYETAQKAGKDVKDYVDEYAEHFKKLLPKLGISEDIHFIRTTDPHHESSAQEFWRRVEKNGFIYKKNYKAKYCVGCESQKTDSEIVDGKCPIHTNLKLEIREEENYFFKFSEFGEKLLDLYEKNPKIVIPDFRLNEMKEFIKRGLEDFSISRLKSKMSWGIPVPDDLDHTMYVWFDALVNYISTLGWPEDEKNFKDFWQNGTPTQYCGKDNTRFQAVMWQAMLMAADLPPTHTVVINGFVTGAGGVKMSKSLGNTINPIAVVDEFGTDALRYFVAKEISSFEDSPFTIERMKSAYNAKLANGLGNLVSRIMKMATANLDGPVKTKPKIPKEFEKAIESFDIQKATSVIWDKISALDLYIQETVPFKVVKDDKRKGRKIIIELVEGLSEIANMLLPIMPSTATTIENLINENKNPLAPLFLRRE